MQIGNSITLLALASGAITGNAQDGWLAVKIDGTAPSPSLIDLRITGNAGEKLNCSLADIIAASPLIPGMQAKKPSANQYIVTIPIDVDKGDVNISVDNNDANPITVTVYDLPDSPEMLANCVELIRKYPTGGSFSDDNAVGIIVSNVALIKSANTPTGTFQDAELVALSAQNAVAASAAAGQYSSNCYLPVVNGKYTVTLDNGWTAGTDYIITVKRTVTPKVGRPGVVQLGNRG